VAVIEKALFPRRKVCGEYISATNLPLFRRLGIAEDFLKLAGPPVRQVGLFARETILAAPMPRADEAPESWGRALGRETLDTVLLDRAAGAGAQVWRPWSATKLERHGQFFLCEMTGRETRERKELRAKVAIAAHGSWEPGALPTQPSRRGLHPADMLGFKAHFRGSSLPAEMMALMVFPGGYGGMVHTDDGRVSVSSCIRRDELERSRRAAPGVPAAESVSLRIQQSCRGAREALAGARLDGAWLSAGPIRPGIRARFADGVFCIGNAAGEAHPIIAEGISMAMQSAWLLCERLGVRKCRAASSEALGEIGKEYSRDWRRSFGARIRAAKLFAGLAVRPGAVGLLLPVMGWFPGLLTFGAWWSGKVKEAVIAPGEVGSAPAAESVEKGGACAAID
jgi:flavin-dependent dehydrogenase